MKKKSGLEKVLEPSSIGAGYDDLLLLPSPSSSLLPNQTLAIVSRTATGTTRHSGVDPKNEITNLARYNAVAFINKIISDGKAKERNRTIHVLFAGIILLLGCGGTGSDSLAVRPR
jgi:hypothetical protein